VNSVRMPEFSALADRAVGVVTSRARQVRGAGARPADVTRALASYREPAMPPELSARIDKALAAEVAKRQSMSLPGSRSRPGAHPRSDDWWHRNIQTQTPKTTPASG